MKIFVDTNIFLDLILKRDNFEDAIVILNAVEKRLYSGAVLDITLLNIDYIANRQVKDIKEFLMLVNSIFKVIGGTNKMFEEALSIDNGDLEDSLQYISAKRAQCDIIVTNDATFYSNDIVKCSSSMFVEKYL